MFHRLQRVRLVIGYDFSKVGPIAWWTVICRRSVGVLTHPCDEVHTRHSVRRLHSEEGVVGFRLIVGCIADRRNMCTQAQTVRGVITGQVSVPCVAAQGRMLRVERDLGDSY